MHWVAGAQTDNRLRWGQVIWMVWMQWKGGDGVAHLVAECYR